MPKDTKTKRVHLIAIGGSVMHNFALALQQKGYQVSGSDDEIYDPASSRLAEAGLLPEAGWRPERISADIEAVIVGMHARKDNPELIKAQEMGLPIYSFPAFFYENSKDKNRVVIAGSHGKTTTTAMIMHVLRHCNKDADYLIGAQLEGFDTMVQLSDAPLAVIEGDEYLSSPLDRRPKIMHYHPHVVVLTGIAWDHVNVFPTFEAYVKQFRLFLEQLGKNSQVYWYQNDQILTDIVPNAAKLVGFKHEAYQAMPNSPEEDATSIRIENNTYRIPLLGSHNLENMQAALLVCEGLGVSPQQFAEAMAVFPGAAKRLQRLWASARQAVYLDFAHAPSKVRATVQAMRRQYPKRTLVACVELHTFSSLQADFLSHYAGTLSGADHAAVFYSPHTLEMKQLPNIEPSQIQDAFGYQGLLVFTESNQLQMWWSKSLEQYQNCVLLLMSSGRFNGAQIPSK